MTDRQTSLDFDAVLRNTQARIRAYIAGFGIAAHEVDDLAQDVYLEFYRGLDKVPADVSPQRWLKGVARNICLNHIRRTSRRGRLQREALAELVAAAQTELHRHATEGSLSEALEEWLPSASRRQSAADRVEISAGSDVADHRQDDGAHRRSRARGSVSSAKQFEGVHRPSPGGRELVMSTVQDIMQQFVDDPEGLSSQQFDALLAAVRESPEAAGELKDQLLVAELLGQRLADDRQGFVTQVQQRIRDELAAPATGEDAAAEAPETLVRQMQALADHELISQREQLVVRRRRNWLLRTAAVVLSVAAVAGGWWYLSRLRPTATVTSVEGRPMLNRDGVTQRLRKGQSLLPGDAVVALPQDFVALDYVDRTQLRLLGDSKIQLPPRGSSGGKRVNLSWGTLHADIAPQPVGRPLRFETPLADAAVLGTQLWLTAEPDRTRLDVTQGVVELTRRSDRAQVTVRASEYAIAAGQVLAVKPLTWPVDRRDLVLLFETAEPGAGNFIFGSAAKEPLEMTARGQARLDANHALVLEGGAMELPAAQTPLLEACVESGELTIEATLQPADLRQTGPARIVTFSTDSHGYNFTLAQQRHWLVCRLRTSDHMGREFEAVQLKADRPQHVVVSYRSGELTAYLDGRRVFQTKEVTGDFSNWGRQPLLLGDEHRGQRDWAGTLEGLAIYDRFMELHEARRNAEQYGRIREQRMVAPQIELVGTLIEKSAPPQPKEIKPAREALVVNRWPDRVDQIIRGDLEEQEVLVAQWAVLAGEPQPTVELELGDQRHLIVQRLGFNPQLETVVPSR